MRRSGASAPERRGGLAGDVRRGLTARPRRLPPRWLYDDVGSALFEAICRLPWYRITRAEERLLARAAPQIAAALPGLDEIVELGPGSGEKLARLIGGLGPRPQSAHPAPGPQRPQRPQRTRGAQQTQGPERAHEARDAGQACTGPLRVHLIDVSPHALALASRTLARFPGLDVRAHRARFEAGLRRLRPRGARRLVLFLGSNIGNYEPAAARAFVQGLAAGLAPGDALLLGVDLVKPASELLLAYDDPIGVTAAFNRNLLARLNRELDARFDLQAFAHQARWNAAERRVEMHLVSTRLQTVAIPGAGLRVRFARGESIWTESSYKYDLRGVDALAAGAGLRRSRRWIDRRARFALVLLAPGEPAPFAQSAAARASDVRNCR